MNAPGNSAPAARTWTGTKPSPTPLPRPPRPSTNSNRAPSPEPTAASNCRYRCGSALADVHVAAALDSVGELLGGAEFRATAARYARLLEWLGGFGTACLAGGAVGGD